MLIPSRHALILEFLLPLLVERWEVKNFVPLLITSLECLLHVEDINFKSRTNNQHWYHPPQRNNHPCYVPWDHLMLVKDFRVIELCLAINDLYSLIKRQRICIWHHLRILQRNLQCYKCIKKNVKEAQNFENKYWSQCSQYLMHFHNPCDGLTLQYVLQK
jgi:hypothetical protein